MASKFQNRLAGAVVLIAMVVIVLPAILDGHKKYYQDDFTAIPLVPKPGDSQQLDALPAINQLLPMQPPEGAAAEVKAGNAASPSLETVRQAANNGRGQNLPRPVPGSAAERDDILALFSDNPPAEGHRGTEPDSSGHVLSAQHSSVPPAAKSDNVLPAGMAYVVQLGALKNADKVNDIVSKLRAAGYRTYTQPPTPVAGTITRILVGPDTNKRKLTNALDDLETISGLRGVVKNYQVQE